MGSVSDDDILIAVIGVTGAGKSTFICKATGRNDLAIGTSLQSCTQTVAFSKTKIDGKTITLIDTPGFDDSERTDADILEAIAKFLRDSYKHGKLLTGVVLLQPINGNRVMGSESRRTRLFEKVLGANAYNHVVIGTTMWSEMANESVGDEYMKHRTQNLWSSMVAGGAEVCRHDNTGISAKRLIRKLLNRSPIVLQMQDELEKNSGKLYDTSAGVQLHSDLSETSKKVFVELQQLRNEMSQTTKHNASLRKDIEELQDQLRAVRQQKEKLESERVTSSAAVPAWITALAAAGSTAAVLAPLLQCVIQ